MIETTELPATIPDDSFVKAYKATVVYFSKQTDDMTKRGEVCYKTMISSTLASFYDEELVSL